MSKAAFSAHKFNRAQFKPLNDSIVVVDMVFDQRISTGGIIIMNDNGKSTGIRPRWAQVYAVGPEQHDIQIGEWILVAHGRWTRGFDVEDESGKHTLRRVDPNDILLRSDVPMDDETFSDAIHVESKSNG